MVARRTAMLAQAFLLFSWVVAAACSKKTSWVSIWGAMPQLTEPDNLPPPPFNSTGVVFQNSTIRQTVMVTLEAQSISLELSNIFGGSDLPITAASIAWPTTQEAGLSGIQSNTSKEISFSGSKSFIIPKGASVISDVIPFPVAAQSIVSISIYLEKGQETNAITSHPGSRTTSFFAPGNLIEQSNLGEKPTSADHWYFISAIDGQVTSAANSTTPSTIAIIGDSITDGRGSTTNGNDRWPDQLLNRLKNDSTIPPVAILNQAAGGNRILNDGLGPNALSRIDRDVTAHLGIRHAIIFEGVNDIGTANTDTVTQMNVRDRIIQAYKQIFHRLHRHGIVVIGATITPMSGPGQSYGDPNREATRQQVNEWIRTSGVFDAVIDFDEVVRDPTHPEKLLPKYDSGDYLHLNPQGYKAMAEAVDLSLFTSK